MNISIYYSGSYDKPNSISQTYLRVRINKKYLKLPLDIYVKPDAFDKEKSKITKGRLKLQQNRVIQEAIGRANKIFLKYDVLEKELTRELFELEFKKPELLSDFYAFMLQEIELRVGEVTNSTITQHKAILNKMKSFRAKLLMSELDEDFVKGFQKHLMYKLHNKTNTVNNALKILRTYVNRAIKKELLFKSPFEYVKLKKVLSYPEFLNEEEMKSLVEIYNNNEFPIRYHRVLRWFLFCCSTGLRIGDLRKVRHEDIRNNILSFHPMKTENVNNRRIDIPLNNFALKLIRNENPQRVKGVLFDLISEQKMRGNLKILIQLAGIEKDIHWHTSRHTFATLFLKQSKRANGIVMLQRLLGHSSIESTMVYSHILNGDLKDAMAAFKF